MRYSVLSYWNGNLPTGEDLQNKLGNLYSWETIVEISSTFMTAVPKCFYFRGSMDAQLK